MKFIVLFEMPLEERNEDRYVILECPTTGYTFGLGARKGIVEAMLKHGFSHDEILRADIYEISNPITISQALLEQYRETQQESIRED